MTHSAEAGAHGQAAARAHVEPEHRPRVVVVAAASPALGGIPTFAELLVSDGHIREQAEMSLLNTTRVAVREAGRLSVDNIRHALEDCVRVFKAGRRADVVHLHAAPGRLFPLLRMLALCASARLSGAGVLCHVHSARINGGAPDGFHPSRLYRFLLRRIAFVDAVLTVADAGTRTLQALLPGVRVETVNNAVDVDSFPVADPEAEPAVLLFVGTLSVRKGLQDLFAAAAEVSAPADSWRLVVVGGAAEVGEREAEQIRSSAEAVGLADALVGPRSGQDLKDTFGAASALVLPSHWEGQPMVILEAMASGLPIVSSRVGAIPDVVRDGVEGLLIDAHDVPALTAALETVIGSPDLRAKWGAAARARAQEAHDMPVLAERLRSLYRDASRVTKRAR
jgi:glycosyltransferase involved in cell wall biosynthesis